MNTKKGKTSEHSRCFAGLTERKTQLWVAGFGSLMLTVCGSLAAEKPQAHTQPATQVTGASALMNGMVNPNLEPTVAWFEWGVNNQYGNVTPATNLDASAQVKRVSLPVEGLQLGERYHCRLVASNRLGIAYGHEQLFGVGRTVLAWGLVEDSPPGSATNVPTGLTDIVALACGDRHRLVVRSDGTVVSWGSVSNTPPGLSNVVAVAGGFHHSLALKKDGTVVGWSISNLPGLTNGIAGLTNVIAIAAGDYHNLVLFDNGQIMTLGEFTYGSIEPPPGVSNIVSIATGPEANYALRSDGAVFAWGSPYLSPTNLPADLTNVVAIDAGYYHFLALRENGSLFNQKAMGGATQSSDPSRGE